MFEAWLLAAVPYLKFLHFCGLLLWCAGLLATPTLLALYPTGRGSVTHHRIVAGTRFTYIAVMSPAALVAVVSGTLLVHPVNAYASWLLVKLTLVAGMVAFHVACGHLMMVLQETPQRYGAAALARLALVPAVLVAGVLTVVLRQPAFF